MKKLTLLFLFITSLQVYSQKSVNDYKYIVIPERFDFVSKIDQYQTSSLTKFLFNKYGFIAFLDSEVLPSDARKDRCSILTAEVVDKSGLFTTKNIIELKDCFNNIIYSSKMGRSKSKDYKTAYHESIRASFESVKSLGYKYVPKSNEALNSSKNSQSTKLDKVIIADTSLNDNSKNIDSSITQNELLYAQPIENGYQLVNSKPIKVFDILNSSLENVFIIKNLNGILFKSDDSWLLEYYKDGQKIQEKINIKF